MVVSYVLQVSWNQKKKTPFAQLCRSFFGAPLLGISHKEVGASVRAEVAAN